MLNFTLDWSNIGSTMIYYPYWAQLNIFAAYIVAAWLLIPIAHLNGIWQSDLYPIQSQSLYTKEGTKVSAYDYLHRGPGEADEMDFSSILLLRS